MFLGNFIFAVFTFKITLSCSFNVDSSDVIAVKKKSLF